MKPTYRIAIADDDAEQRAILRRCIIEAGHEVVVEAKSGEELVLNCPGPVDSTIQLVITDISMGTLDGIEAGAQILKQWEIPFLVVSGFDDDELIERASDGRALGFLVKPVRLSELKAAIAIAAERFRELRESRSEACVLREALEERKIVERAKGILMREKALDESEAFRSLQQLARDSRQKLVEVAKSIILAVKVLH